MEEDTGMAQDVVPVSFYAGYGVFRILFYFFPRIRVTVPMGIMVPEPIGKEGCLLEDADKLQRVASIKRLLSVKEVCVYLGIGQTKARELLRGNNGFAVQIGNRWYADRKKLDVWIEKSVR